jgi:hypothetical protein
MTLVFWTALAAAQESLTIEWPIAVTVPLPAPWTAIDEDDGRLPDGARGAFTLGVVDGAGGLAAWVQPEVSLLSCAEQRVLDEVDADDDDAAFGEDTARLGAKWSRWVRTDEDGVWPRECVDTATGSFQFWVSPFAKPGELEPLGEAVRTAVVSAPFAPGFVSKVTVGDLPAAALPAGWSLESTDPERATAWVAWVNAPNDLIQVEIEHAAGDCASAVAARNRRAATEGWSNFKTERLDPSSTLGPAWSSIKVDPNVRVGTCTSIPGRGSLVFTFSTYFTRAGGNAPAVAADALMPQIRLAILDQLPGETITVPRTEGRVTLPARWSASPAGDGLRLVRADAAGRDEYSLTLRPVGGCPGGRGDLFSSGSGRFAENGDGWCTDTLGNGALALQGSAPESVVSEILSGIAGTLPVKRRPTPPTPPASANANTTLTSLYAGYDYVGQPLSWAGSLGVVSVGAEGHLIGDKRSPIVLDYRARTGAGIGGGLLLDGQAMIGLSGASLFGGRVGPTVSVGLGVDGLGAKKLPLSISLPAQVGVTARLSDELVLRVYGELGWHTAPIRQKGVAWLPFTDELELGAKLWICDRDRSPGQGLFLGGRYGQHAHAWFAGGQIGFAFGEDD